MNISQYTFTAVNLNPWYICSVLLGIHSLCLQCLLMELTACLKLCRGFSSCYLGPWGCTSSHSLSAPEVTLSCSSSFSISYSDTHYLLVSIYMRQISPSLPIQSHRILLLTFWQAPVGPQYVSPIVSRSVEVNYQTLGLKNEANIKVP